MERYDSKAIVLFGFLVVMGILLLLLETNAIDVNVNQLCVVVGDEQNGDLTYEVLRVGIGCNEFEGVN